ncbi:MAG: hypothetical protein JW731_01365 [Bacteroidales bacterium]|nr:hypothetical protein [Bacteroidales bacterium]
MKFIIFAHARSGSTNLGICLDQHPEIEVIGEPFHQSYQKWHPTERNYIKYIHDVTSLDLQLEKIFSVYPGIKTLEYQLTPKLNAHMISRPDIRIIFLQRKNLLQTMISGVIASRTNIWYQRVDEENEANLLPGLKPIPVNQIRKEMIALRNKLNYYSGILQKRPENTWLNITYEDLYTSDLSKNLEKLSEIFDFLDLGMPDVSEISDFLNPEKAKMNSIETYQQIPNIQEIEQALGNDETGWLFE